MNTPKTCRTIDAHILENASKMQQMRLKKMNVESLEKIINPTNYGDSP